MSGSVFGKNFSISTFGESHGKAIGVIVDGCPSGISITLEDIMKDMIRRKPGNATISTPRKEADEVEILSGIFEGRTTGTPISLLIRNTDQRSHNYDTIKDIYRPSHADYTYDKKYGFRDYRGGGRSSARETAARVAAGAIARCFLKELGIEVIAYTKSIGPIAVEDASINLTHIKENILSMPDNLKALEAISYISEMKQAKDSIGGVVECIVTGMIPGIGDPVFDKLDALLGGAIMSINAVKAFEVGIGIGAATMQGSMYNDSFYLDDSLGSTPKVSKHTNHSGGILGGISDGSPLILRAHFKPTPSIASLQHTLNNQLEHVTAQIEGRHDPTVVPRAVVVVEAMVALTLADLLLSLTHSSIDRVKNALSSSTY
ncbi:MAG: chorismate synthase [Cellulosilyticaceae bacterium]